MEVTGGAGGTAADLDAMAGAGDALLACGRELEHAVVRLAGVVSEADLLATAALDPGGSADAQARLVRLLVGGEGLTALAARTTALGMAVRGAAWAYATGDAAVASGFVSVRDTVAVSAGEVIWQVAWRFGALVAPAAALAAGTIVAWRTGDLVVVAAAAVLDDALDGTLEVDSLSRRLDALTAAASRRLAADAAGAADAGLGWLARHPRAAEHAMGASPSFLSGVSGLSAVPTMSGVVEGAAEPWSFPPRDVEDLAAVIAVVGYGVGVLRRGRVGVRPATAPPPAPAAPPSGVQDLVRRAVDLSPSRTAPPGQPGRIRVERVRAATGATAAVVYVPGTQSWGLGSGTNPMDSTGNLDALAGIESDAQDGVVQALRLAGVGAGEPLLLVGYSQGGLTSMALAEDAAFRAEFFPAAVLTVGAPVAEFDVPDDVAVLSLEHTEDLVTGMDGAANPDRTNWTTVRRDVLDPVTGDRRVEASLDGNPLAPHGADAYLGTAALVDDLDHDSIQEWRRRAATFLDAHGATTSTTDWVAERVTRNDVPASGTGR